VPRCPDNYPPELNAVNKLLIISVLRMIMHNELFPCFTINAFCKLEFHKLNKTIEMTAMEFSSKLMNLRNNLQYFAYTLTNDKEEVKDLLQDTYLKALVNRDKFADDTNLKDWTFTIMKNTFINNYRNNHNFNTIVDNPEDLFYLNIQRKSEFPSPSSEFHLKEIHQKIAKLDEVQRLPFEMHVSGYKYREIAERLNISIGTVKSRIFFSRKKLMESLEDAQSELS